MIDYLKELDIDENFIDNLYESDSFIVEDLYNNKRNCLRIFGYLTGIGVRDPKSVFYEYPDLFTFDYDYFLEKIDKAGNLEDFVNNVNKDISYIEILYK